METEIQRFERLCKKAGIPTTTINFYISSPDRIFLFYKEVLKDCNEQNSQKNEQNAEIVNKTQEKPFNQSENDDQPLDCDDGKCEVDYDYDCKGSKPEGCTCHRCLKGNGKLKLTNSDELILTKLKRYTRISGLTSEELSNLCALSLRTIYYRTKVLSEAGMIEEGEHEGRGVTWRLKK